MVTRALSFNQLIVRSVGTLGKPSLMLRMRHPMLEGPSYFSVGACLT
jgi:hypothetical protein